MKYNNALLRKIYSLTLLNFRRARRYRVKINMKNFILCFFFISLASSRVFAADSYLCVGEDKSLESYYGDFQEVVLGEATTFKVMVKSVLTNHAMEIQRVVNLSVEYTGPDNEYVQRLISLLGESAGFEKEINCMWNHYEKEDEIKNFSENTGSFSRKGYVILRKGVAIAHFYSQLAVE